MFFHTIKGERNIHFIAYALASLGVLSRYDDFVDREGVLYSFKLNEDLEFWEKNKKISVAIEWARMGHPVESVYSTILPVFPYCQKFYEMFPWVCNFDSYSVVDFIRSDKYLRYSYSGQRVNLNSSAVARFLYDKHFEHKNRS